MINFSNDFFEADSLQNSPSTTTRMWSFFKKTTCLQQFVYRFTIQESSCRKGSLSTKKIFFVHLQKFANKTKSSIKIWHKDAKKT